MSMSTRVEAIIPPTELWSKMRAVWVACTEAGLSVPTPVAEFFQGDEPDPDGVVVGMRTLKQRGAVVDWGDDCSSGYEVILDKLPPGVSRIRFCNSW
jgi:hypothetical protein